MPRDSQAGCFEVEDSKDSAESAGLDRLLVLGRTEDGERLQVCEPGPVLSIGGSVSGKRDSLIIPNLLNYKGSCVIVDPNGDAARTTAAARQRWAGAKTFIVDPLGVMGRGYGVGAEGRAKVVRYNPLSVLDGAPGALGAEAVGFAEPLVIAKDGCFDDAAGELLAGLIAYVVEEPEFRADASYGLVRRLLTMTSAELRGLARRAVQGLGGASVAARKLCQFASDDWSSASLPAVLATARVHTGFLDGGVVESLAESDFSLDELCRGVATVYLVLPAENLDSHGRWLRLMVSAAIQAVARAGVSGGLPVLLVLEEFGCLAGLKSVERAYGRGRGLAVWVFARNIEELREWYGVRWDGFAANARVMTCFDVRDENTAEYLARISGEAVEDILRLGPERMMIFGGERGVMCRRVFYGKDRYFGSLGRAQKRPRASKGRRSGRAGNG